MNELCNYILFYLYFEPNSKNGNISKSLRIPYYKCENGLIELIRKKYVDKILIDNDYIYYLSDKGTDYFLSNFNGIKVDNEIILKFAEDKNYDMKKFKSYQKYQKENIELLKFKLTYEEFCVIKQYENVSEDVSLSVYLLYLGLDDDDNLLDFFDFKTYCEKRDINPYCEQLKIKKKTS